MKVVVVCYIKIRELINDEHFPNLVYAVSCDVYGFMLDGVFSIFINGLRKVRCEPSKVCKVEVFASDFAVQLYSPLDSRHSLLFKLKHESMPCQNQNLSVDRYFGVLNLDYRLPEALE